jgi:uncharacterized membrane protein
LRRERPAEIAALLLRAVRPLVPVLGIGLSMVVVFGIWLAERLGIGLGAGWITATFVLLGWIVVAGRQERRTRELAEQLARDGDAPSAELSHRLHDPVNLALTASLLIATVAIVALMVWKP